MFDTQDFDQVLKMWVRVFMLHSMQAFTQWMAENNLSRSQMGALMHLHFQEQCPVSNIGTELGITTPAASQLVDRLVQTELLERVEDPDDRRVKNVNLSDAGRQLMYEAFEARLDWMKELAKVLSEQEQENVIQTLNVLIQAARQIEGNPELKKEITEHRMKI